MKTWTWIIIFVILIGASIGLMFSVYKMFDSGDAGKAASSSNQASNKVDEFKEQTKKIGGVTYDLNLSESPEEREVIAAMHHMTHQKVKADKKWGAKPMIPETINEIFDVVSKSDFARKEELLAILERWKNGDFSLADVDHNYFWDYQNGNTGEAYGLMSEAEERRFILDNFGEEYLPD
ncbi:PRK06770 family protein [Bacillus sp. JJ1562]|uniref:PRK06770 family protein n=1 Tax=Bacillus sp. JJ1562 TaxID=3122960 RepID=UPI0030020CA2